MAKTKYTKQYFYEKFKALKDKDVGRDSLGNHCALYHCGVKKDYKPTPEALALGRIVMKEWPYVKRITLDDPSEAVWRYNDRGYREALPRQLWLKLLAPK